MNSGGMGWLVGAVLALGLGLALRAGVLAMTMERYALAQQALQHVAEGLR